jgi:hypothetical protein
MNSSIFEFNSLKIIFWAADKINFPKPLFFWRLSVLSMLAGIT